MITDFSATWIYYTGDVYPGDFNFEIYNGDLNTRPYYEFTIAEEDYDEYDTGINAYGRDVYRGDVPFGVYEFDLDAGTTYWFALQRVSDDNVLLNVHCTIVGDVFYWYGDDGIWESSFDSFGINAEGSYAIYGNENTAIKSSSLGNLKALFK